MRRARRALGGSGGGGSSEARRFSAHKRTAGK
jgi:hypothetical protein